MAVSIDLKVDSDELVRELQREGQKWAKQMEWATKDMRRAAPTIVANHTVQRYAIKKGEVNANSKSFVGGCKMSGGIASLRLDYSGRMLTPTHFKMAPSAAPAGGRKYAIKATVLKGRRVEIGRWQSPWSAGGTYGKKASPMFMPGKVPPISRDGGRTYRKGAKFGHAGGRYEAVKMISVPQMVGSDHIIDGTIEELNERRMEILERRLRSLGLG